MRTRTHASVQQSVKPQIVWGIDSNIFFSQFFTFFFVEILTFFLLVSSNLNLNFSFFLLQISESQWAPEGAACSTFYDFSDRPATVQKSKI